MFLYLSMYRPHLLNASTMCDVAEWQFFTRNGCFFCNVRTIPTNSREKNRIADIRDGNGFMVFGKTTEQVQQISHNYLLMLKANLT